MGLRWAAEDGDDRFDRDDVFSVSERVVVAAHVALCVSGHRGSVDRRPYAPGFERRSRTDLLATTSPCDTAFMRFVIALSLIVLASCATYHDELVRAQTAFDNNQHERTLALLRDLEPDVTRLPQPEQAHYAYLRGMTDYRIGYKTEARHWLAIARAFDEQSPGILPTDWKQRTTETLAELDGVVQTQGYAALSAPAK